jgi:hypothetical protein
LPDGSRAEFLAWAAPIPFGSSCTFLDYDGDGRLDLFVATTSPGRRIDLGINATLVSGAGVCARRSSMPVQPVAEHRRQTL